MDMDCTFPCWLDTLPGGEAGVRAVPSTLSHQSRSDLIAHLLGFPLDDISPLRSLETYIKSFQPRRIPAMCHVCQCRYREMEDEKSVMVSIINLAESRVP